MRGIKYMTIVSALILLKNPMFVYADDRRRTVHSLERKLGEVESLVSRISDQSCRDVAI